MRKEALDWPGEGHRPSQVAEVSEAQTPRETHTHLDLVGPGQHPHPGQPGSALPTSRTLLQASSKPPPTQKAAGGGTLRPCRASGWPPGGSLVLSKEWARPAPPGFLSGCSWLRPLQCSQGNQDWETCSPQVTRQAGREEASCSSSTGTPLWLVPGTWRTEAKTPEEGVLYIPQLCHRGAQA